MSTFTARIVPEVAAFASRYRDARVPRAAFASRYRDARVPRAALDGAGAATPASAASTL
jgi:hypothetical protein